MGGIRVFRHLWCLLFILLFLPAWASAWSPADYTMEEVRKMRPEKYYANNKLTFGSFMEDYESLDLDVRRNAFVYLYGVIDATENKEWCSFWTIKSNSVFEYLHDELQKADKSKYNERAAHVIIGVISKVFHCNEENSK